MYLDYKVGKGTLAMSWISIEIESILVLTNNVYSDPILMKEIMVFWIGKPTLDPKKASRKRVDCIYNWKNQSLSYQLA